MRTHVMMMRLTQLNVVCTAGCAAWIKRERFAAEPSTRVCVGAADQLESLDGDAVAVVPLRASAPARALGWVSRSASTVCYKTRFLTCAVLVVCVGNCIALWWNSYLSLTQS